MPSQKKIVTQNNKQLIVIKEEKNLINKQRKKQELGKQCGNMQWLHYLQEQF